METRFISGSASEFSSSLLPLYFENEYGTIQDYINPIIVEAPNNFFTKGVIEDATFVSLPRSPFGGIFYQGYVNEADFRAFVDQIRDRLVGLGVTNWQLTMPPPIYSGFVKSEWLEKYGFDLIYTDFNQHIDLENRIPLHPMEQRRYRKALRSELNFCAAENSEMEDLYDFLAKAREQQGLEINLSKNRFSRLLSAYPNRYSGYLVKGNDEKWLAALLKGDHIAPKIDYYFLPGHNRSYNKLSPMVFLIESLLKLMRSEGKKYLDLGVSSFQGQKQESLFIFKERMGAVSTLKKTYNLRI